MPTLLNKLQRGITTGAALWLGGAGCSDSIRRPPVPDADTDAQMMISDAAIDSAVDSAVGVDGAIADAGVLLPYPLDALTCGAFGTPCCYYATCVEVVNARCPAVGDSSLPFQPVDLTCGVTGPFAPNPDDVNAPAGNCCYITGSQAAVGRPLLVQQAMLIAPVITRSDWLLG